MSIKCSKWLQGDITLNYCYLHISFISFLHKAIVHRSVFVPLSKRDSNTHEYAHSWSSQDSDRNQQNNQLSSPFLYNTFLYWLANLLIDITFCIGKFFRQVKETNETTNLEARSFIFILILINKLTCHYNFSLLASFILYGRFCANKHVCLNMHRLCSINNWLRVLITDN